ncbi:alpha/beta hydrolase family protein [Undibacterium terreum]|uniref:Peptidase S9 prolyl oligopeptidase catalytic domain-containing protein n=1 Tax=Undibacterium terreum TaxID=1224302 RepID=A0A916UX79_9BURK|nr:prolyl oligopeptidase family serine peptidase [Undibacterium terreum]GGC91192.1 hypothetical protein GCM10011396_43080 [Undibacterium terreum]
MLVRKSTLIGIIAAILGISSAAASSAATAENAPVISLDEIFKAPTYFGSQLSPSGKYIVSLRLHDSKTALSIIDNSSQSQEQKELALEANYVPNVFFFDPQKDDLFIFATDMNRRTPVLLKADLQRASAVLLEENLKPSYISVSWANQYRFPQIALIDSTDGKRYRVWDQENSIFVTVDAIDGIRPVAVLPHHMPGYIGQKMEEGQLAWFFVNQDKRQTRLATLTSSKSPEKCELISIYQGGDRKYKAAFLGGDSTDSLALFEVDLGSGDITILRSNRADIRDAMISPTTHVPDAVKTDFQSPEWISLTSGIAPFIDKLSELPGYLSAISRSKDDRIWLATFSNESNFKKYYLYDTNLNEIKPIQQLNEGNAQFSNPSSMRPFVYKTADNVEILSYLTFPSKTGCNSKHRCPLVVNLHGGPKARDSIGFQRENALLANKGYAVLNINYRGSRGFGKVFEHLSDGEWGGRMLDDVEDVTKHVLSSGNFDRQRVAVIGGSHGVYLTLMAATDVRQGFKCAVAYSATADLESFVRFNVANNKALAYDLYSQIGNPDSEDVRSRMAQRSPISRTKNLTAKLLLLHGAKDRSASIDDIKAFVNRATEEKMPISFLVFPEGSHFVSQGQAQRPFYLALEGFLDQCLEQNGKKPKPIYLPSEIVTIEKDENKSFTSKNKL